jgi:2'-5' RNA ligase
LLGFSFIHKSAIEPGMLRLFTALPVPEDVVTRLTGLQTGLENAHWRPVINFHITLCFVGDINTETAHAFDEALAQISMAPFKLKISGVHWFGKRKPRSVWARIAMNPGLVHLAAACEQAARQIGLAPEARAFTPHITLAYLSSSPLEDVTTWCEARNGFRAGPFTADRFHLVSSQLGKGPSHYTSEAEYPLV